MDLPHCWGYTTSSSINRGDSISVSVVDFILGRKSGEVPLLFRLLPHQRGSTYTVCSVFNFINAPVYIAKCTSVS